MANETDLDFSFDPSVIEKGIDRVVSKLAVLAGAFKVVQGAIDNIPEIGQAFGIAKDVFVKNLLFPLRKEILPLLQKMLDWVRDNRATFVKWGQAIASVFRTAVDMIKNAIGFIQKATEGLFGFISRVFNTTIGSFEEIFNLVLFKIATVIEFIKALIQPFRKLFDPIVDLFVNVLQNAIEMVMGLISGLAPHLMPIAEAFANIANDIITLTNGLMQMQRESGIIKTIWTGIGEAIGRVVSFVSKMIESFTGPFRQVLEENKEVFEEFFSTLNKVFEQIGAVINDIVTTLFDGEDALQGWTDAFSLIGKIVGTVLVGAVKGLKAVLDGVLFVLKGITDFFNSSAFKGAMDAVGGFFNTVGGVVGGAVETVGGAITGTPAPTTTQAAPTISNTTSRSQSNTIYVGGVSMPLTNASPEQAQQAGEAFVETLRNEYNADYVGGGR